MKQIAGVAGIALLAAACAGAPTHYETVGATRTPANMIACAADAITDDGFVITTRNDAEGVLQASHGNDLDDVGDSVPWLLVNVVGVEATHYIIRVETSDDDISKESARDIVEECGT